MEEGNLDEQISLLLNCTILSESAVKQLCNKVRHQREDPLNFHLNFSS
jgi:hypothetical protein